MKKTILIILLGCVVFSLYAGSSAEIIQNSEKAKQSYAFGMAIALDLSQTGIDFDYNAFIRGFRDFLENNGTPMSIDEAYEIVDTAIYEAMAAQADLNLQYEKTFLLENGARPGIFTTSSGLQYEILHEGAGEQPSEDDIVVVHYTGYLLDGTVFDSSYDYGEPAEFPLQVVIPGWKEGLMLMREGGASRLFIPSALAYGSRGASGVIPPNAMIIFEVELLQIIRDYYPNPQFGF